MKKKISIDSDSKVKPTWKVFEEGNSTEVDRLYRIYAQDHQKAKVIYTQNKKGFKVTRLLLFEWPNGDFKIVEVTKTYGISKNAVLYHREKTNWSIIYKKKGHKFYYVSHNRVTQLTFSGLSSSMSLYVGGNYQEDKKTAIKTPQYEFLLSKFGWILNVAENTMFHTMSFSVIRRKKLYSGNTLLKHYFGSPIQTCKMLLKIEEGSGWRSWNRFDKSWSEMKKHLINLENITLDFLKSEFLYDTTLLAEALGRKINCAWSPKRVKLEHDEWTREAIDIILEFEPLRDLKISKIFDEFQMFSGYKMFRTNHELIEEGKLMKHCVGMYSDTVDSGKSAIYHVNNHTLELKTLYGDDTKVTIAQYMGYNNKYASAEIRLDVENMINNFNEQNSSITKEDLISQPIEHQEGIEYF